MTKSITQQFLLDKIEGLIERSFEYASGTYNQADPTAYSHSKIVFHNLTILVLDVCWATEIRICVGKRKKQLASIHLIDGELKPNTNWDHKWFKLFDKIIATQPINMSRYPNNDEEEPWCPMGYM